MSPTKRQRRAQRKRARKVHVHGGGFTSVRRAIELVRGGRASINESGDLEIIPRTQDPLDGFKFHWYPDVSGGFTVMKARANHGHPHR